jgi:hypothetical protein
MMNPSRDEEAHQDGHHGATAAARLLEAPLLAVSLGHGEERRGGGQRVDDRQQPDAGAEEEPPQVEEVGHRRRDTSDVAEGTVT